MQQAQATIAAKQKNKTQNKAMLILIILFGVDKWNVWWWRLQFRSHHCCYN